MREIPFIPLLSCAKNILEMGKAAAREDDEGVHRNSAQIQTDLKEFLDQYEDGQNNYTALLPEQLYRSFDLPRDAVELIKAIARNDPTGTATNLTQMNETLKMLNLGTIQKNKP